MENLISKKLKHKETIVRSRINADKELWDSIPILKQESRTSGKCQLETKNFLDQ
jgi:hypothetical protein